MAVALEQQVVEQLGGVDAGARGACAATLVSGGGLVVGRVAELEDAVEAHRDVRGHLDGRLLAEDAGAHLGVAQARHQLVERQPRERGVASGGC